MNRALSPYRLATLGRQLLVACAGLACTLPAFAGVTIPNTPLQTGATIPPNVTMLFDNSGSMFWRYLYIHNTDSGHTFPSISVPKGVDGSSSTVTSSATGNETSKDNFSGSVADKYGNTCSDNGSTEVDCVVTSIYGSQYMVDQASATNGLYYNPSTNYTPWYYPDGTQVTAPAYTAVYQNHNNAKYNWTALDGTTTINLTSGTNNLKTHTQTFYVLKTATDTYCPTIDRSKAQCYYRYQILGSTEFSGNAAQIYRSELLEVGDVTTTQTTTTTTPVAPSTTQNTGQTTNHGTLKQISSITAPSSPSTASSIQFAITGGNSNGSNNTSAVLYERKGSQPSTGTKDNTATSGNSFTINEIGRAHV